jgi:two-component system response regulator DegU
MNILIVDDNERIRSTIRNILAGPDVECFECASGALALERFREIRPAWVLMDIMMPGTNGLKATEGILAADPRAQVAIVTNYDDNEFRKAAKEAGAIAYVSKEHLTDLRKLCLPQSDTLANDGMEKFFL